ncbi:aspartic peptidase domain-containing protein [Rhypophila decipiens]|uniref:Aspartic peptidase domain-containing protein n=1 Tax=Rhypophila decipiens TaxID=261697 RepID=A0AAN6XU65_9PEZI|nr:aspartic peptidase domain-containing protein [Rhypophila decipiens]
MSTPSPGTQKSTPAPATPTVASLAKQIEALTLDTTQRFQAAEATINERADIVKALQKKKAKIAMPPRYGGDPLKLKAWLAQCRAYFDYYEDQVSSLPTPYTPNPCPASYQFIDNIKDDLVSPVFTANLKHSIEGNYNFGYLNASEYIPNPNSSPEDQGIAYAPIDPKSVYWTFLATGYGVGPPIENFEPTAKTADTGTTLLLVPSQIVRAYYARVTGSVYDPFWAGMIIPCEAELPDFSFYIGPGGSTYRGVVPGRYMNYVSFNGSHCYGGIQSSDGIGFAVFGALLIKSQFVVFDVGGKRIGFAGKELAT